MKGLGVPEQTHQGIPGLYLIPIWPKLSCNIEISHNMEDFYTLEVFLKFADFYAVSVCGLVGAVPILIDLVDDHRGVAIDEQMLDAK